MAEHEDLAGRIREYVASLGDKVDPDTAAMMEDWADDAEELQLSAWVDDDEYPRLLEVRLIQFPTQGRICIAWCRPGDDLTDMLDEEADPSGATYTSVKSRGMVTFRLEKVEAVAMFDDDLPTRWRDYQWTCTGGSEETYDRLPDPRLALLRSAEDPIYAAGAEERDRAMFAAAKETQAALSGESVEPLAPRAPNPRFGSVEYYKMAAKYSKPFNDSVKRHKRIERVAESLLKIADRNERERAWQEVFGTDPENPVMDVEKIEATYRIQQERKRKP